MRGKIYKITLSLCVLSLCTVPRLWPSASGLNNIPTADVPPDKTLVIQEYSTFGDNQGHTHTIGFKTGFFGWLELGWDRQIGSGPTGANLFQTKLRWKPKNEIWPAFAAGVANVAFSFHGRELSGQPFPYVVASRDWGWARTHLGGHFQKDNRGVFSGLDKEIFPGFTFRTDVITVNDIDDALFSVGGIYVPGWELPFNIAIEGWYSRPTDSDVEGYFLLKWNYVIQF